MATLTSPDGEFIYEVWDRLTRQRAMEIVFLNANDALTWLAGAGGDPKNYRVQGVKVWRP